MENSPEYLKDNKETMPMKMEVRLTSLSNTYIVDRLLNALNITLPEEMETRYADCRTIAGIVDAYVRREVKYLCTTIAETCFSQVTYQSIQEANDAVNARKEYYIGIVNECELLFNEITTSTMDSTSFLSCPVDTSIVIDEGGMWIKDVRDHMLMEYSCISTTPDLLRAVRCKYDYLMVKCDELLTIRAEITNSKDLCGMMMDHYYSMREEIVKMSAQKYLDDNDYFTTTAPKRKKYRQKVMKRMTKSKLYPYYHDYVLDHASFAFYAANTEGIDNSQLADFIIDAEILNRMNCKELLFPWLKADYHNQLKELNGMLMEAWLMCTSPNVGKTHTQAYVLIWYWMLEHLKMSVAGVDKGVDMFTTLLNKVTGADVKASTMPKEISNNRKTDYQQMYLLLDTFALKYGFLTLK